MSKFNAHKWWEYFFSIFFVLEYLTFICYVALTRDVTIQSVHFNKFVLAYNK